jgi:hypothetical protein
MIRLYAALALIALLALGGWWLHHAGYASGKADCEAVHAVTAAQAVASARAIEHQQTTDFAGIASDYLQATTHDYPSIADTLPAAVAAGTMRLRDDCPASGDVSAAAARARGVDAAAAAATQRLATAVAAVRAGDEADARERQLGAQVTALQGLLTAERKD